MKTRAALAGETAAWALAADPASVILYFLSVGSAACLSAHSNLADKLLPLFHASHNHIPEDSLFSDTLLAYVQWRGGPHLNQR